MSVDDDDDGVDRLPTRAAPGGTRTDTRLAPRETTSITKPLITADESAEDDVSDDEADLFEDPATVAEVAALPADTTRISALRNAHDVVRDDRSDDEDDEDDEDDDDEAEAGAERTVVSMVVPEHLLDKPSMPGVPPTLASDGLFDDADLGDTVDGGVDNAVTEPFVPRPTEVVTTRLPARPTSTARPGWVLALMVFGGVVGAALIVIFIVALVR